MRRVGLVLFWAPFSGPRRSRSRDSAPSYYRPVDRRPENRHRVTTCRGNLAGLTDNREDFRMTWTAPKLEEISCGMEINMYFPADDEGDLF